MASREESVLIARIYAAALERDPEERSDYLDKACAGKPRLRGQVEALLAAQPEGPAPSTAPACVEPATEAMPAERTIGPYIIRGELGRGGMGVVYLADDVRLSRRVALKALTPGVAREPGSRDRLRLEARAAAALAHPGIATVYALEEIDDELYMACEYVPGEPLRALLASGPLPLGVVVQIGVQLARALAAAHTQGVVHRDIKPENVVQTPSGIIKVLDFGLARADFAVETKLTQTGVILGTPAYMAPEQALGERGDFKTDIYALGLLLYELATGHNPFAASTALSTLARVVKLEPPPPSAMVQHESPDFDRIIATCLRKEPRNRYRSTMEVVADLERLDVILNGPPSSPHYQSDAFGLAGQSAFSRRRWWECHQLVVAAVCVLMLYPAWRARSWLPEPWGLALMGLALVAAAASTTLRLNLVFLSRFAAEELDRQRRTSERWVRLCDFGFAGSELATAVAIGQAHPEIAMLLVAVAVSLVIAAVVIEPATARAAFGAGKTGP
jgi:serine/threonine protein kinase